MPDNWKHSSGQRIEKIYAWVCTEPDGGQGIPAIDLKGMAYPLIGADRDRVESLRPYAVDVRVTKGYPVELVEFSGRTVLETLD